MKWFMIFTLASGCYNTLCRPRLRERYFATFDRYLAEGPKDAPIDEPQLVQSAPPVSAK